METTLTGPDKLGEQCVVYTPKYKLGIKEDIVRSCKEYLESESN